MLPGAGPAPEHVGTARENAGGGDVAEHSAPLPGEHTAMSEFAERLRTAFCELERVTLTVTRKAELTRRLLAVCTAAKRDVGAARARLERVIAQLGAAAAKGTNPPDRHPEGAPET